MKFPWRLSSGNATGTAFPFRAYCLVFASLALLFAAPLRTSAVGFGISPPYVRNNSLTRGSHYEQKIMLVRGDAADSLKVNITVNVPGADKWISVDRGTEFIMPQGETQVPVIVSVDVPNDAPFKEYKGYVRIVVSPLSLPQAGTVGVTIGAQANVDLNIVDKKIIDFNILNVSLSDAEVGHTFWWMHFPGKITASILAKNVGNVRAAPSKIVLDIYDSRSGQLLEETQNSNGIEQIAPFDTKSVTAEIPTFLPIGSYRAAYKVYKNDTDVISTGNLDLSILPPGSITGYAGYGFMGLPLRDKAITFGLIALILGLIYYIYRQIFILRPRRKKGKKPTTVVHPPPRPPQA